MQFNPGNLLPLDSFGTVYPDIRIIDEWDILTVSNGALMTPNFSKIYVSAPSYLTLSPIQGDGWTLELNQGWTITNGERRRLRCEKIGRKLFIKIKFLSGKIIERKMLTEIVASDTTIR